MVLRIRELAVQMANGIYEDTPDRDNAQLEVAALLNQVTLSQKIQSSTMLHCDGSFTTVNIQAGNNTAETIELSFIDVGQTGLSINGADVGSQASAVAVMGTMDTALNSIAAEQAKFGSLINRLNFSIANLSKSSVTTEQAIGRVVDADFAAETTNLSKQQILNQAATSMLAQANQSKQSILALLQ